MKSSESFSVAALPKAELHLHLEGSLSAATLREVEPSLSEADIEERHCYEGFQGFLECFKWVAGHLRTPAAYGLATRRLLESLASQNVSYAEITLSAGVVLWRGMDFDEVFAAVSDAAAGSAVRVRWIVDGVRHFGAEHVAAVAELAVAHARNGVVALGIGGDEARGPARLFSEIYRHAKNRGLRLVAHAGETCGPESIWAALEIGAERIGHGFRAVEDPALVRHLTDNEIPLEICLTSNVATGLVESVAAHPVRKLYDAGVPVILNTDDPGIFRTTLNREFKLALEHHFSPAELAGIAANGFRYAFA
ncbi:MAG: adenosine deaminase [Bryobacterales bacterium]|nr:adenosine deaminase [Bryobacterales bacterium]